MQRHADMLATTAAQGLLVRTGLSKACSKMLNSSKTARYPSSNNAAPITATTHARGNRNQVTTAAVSAVKQNDLSTHNAAKACSISKAGRTHLLDLGLNEGPARSLF